MPLFEEALKSSSNGGVANLLACTEMPDTGVTLRTQATRGTGAYFMLEHLMQGDFDSHGSHAVIKEFLGRAVANAARQGIEMEVPRVESPVITRNP